MTIEAIAHICHDANRTLQLETSQPGVDPEIDPTWESSPRWYREAILDGVRHALDGDSPEDIHNAWMDFRAAQGWVWGPVKDKVAKTHPSMVPYDQLPEDEKTKDYLFHGIVNALTRQTERV